MNKCRQLLINYCQTYPKLKPYDIFKFLYQSAFGCEHMVSDEKAVTEYIKKEAAEAVCDENVLFEELDGEYARVHLSYLKKGLSAETLGKLFCLSAVKEENGVEKLAQLLKEAIEMAYKGLLPFEYSEFEKALKTWEKEGFAPVHHSENFRNEYHPAYRVISKKFLPFLPVFAKIDELLEKGFVHMSLEGKCASGKSTFAHLLESVYGCNVFHMDDFFLRPEQRTPERYAEIGGNIDKERFLSEVLEPYQSSGIAEYRRFDCSSLTVMPSVHIKKTPLTVTEGVYCMHPNLSEYYNYSVFLNISEELQKKRIIKRNSPQFAKRFFEEWIPMENCYFSEMDVKNRCDIIIDVG